jgi:hypothetical protein
VIVPGGEEGWPRVSCLSILTCELLFVYAISIGSLDDHSSFSTETVPPLAAPHAYSITPAVAAGPETADFGVQVEQVETSIETDPMTEPEVTPAMPFASLPII